jgi:protoporphyrinogen oxidase
LSKTDRNRHVIVLGAGPGGLACAHKLTEYGYKVTVLEKEGFVGGLSRTLVRDGFRFDFGGHRWFTKNKQLHDWFLRLMDGQLVEVERISRILFNGKYFDYPISIKNVLQTAGLWTSFLCVLDYGRNTLAQAMKARKIDTMEDAFVSQFGRRLFDMFFRRYSEKVWGRPCSKMSADWVSQRSKGLSIWTAITNALLKPKDKKAKTLIETFVYPRHGYQEIPETMRRDCEKRGNKVILDAFVKKVDVRDPQKVVVTYEKSGRSETITGDYVVSTVPLTSLLAYALEPKPPAEVIAAAKSLEFRSVITVNLMLDVPQMTKDTWIYCHDEGLGFARLHEPRNWSPDMAPPGKSSVVLEYFCHKDDDVWRKSEQEMVDWGKRDVCRLGFVKPEQILGGFTERAGNAYPVYSLGYLEKLKAMRKHIEQLDRVAIVGRGGTFRYNNADHSIEMGLVTAQMINGEVDKVAVLDINTDLEYQEKDMVEAGLEGATLVKPTEAPTAARA